MDYSKILNIYLKINKTSLKHVITKRPNYNILVFLLFYIENYNSNAFCTLLFINNSTGFSNASFTATKKPTDSLPSIIR